MVFVLYYNMEPPHFIQSVSISIKHFPQNSLAEEVQLIVPYVYLTLLLRSFSFREYSRTNSIIENHVKNDVKNHIGDAFQKIKTQICLCQIFLLKRGKQTSKQCKLWWAAACALALIKFSGLLDCIILYNKM